MEVITASYLTRPEFWLLVTTLLYFLMNGAQIFETLIFVPKWATCPPRTYELLLDGKGTGLKSFWIVFHSVHELTFIITIILYWQIDPIRNWLLTLFMVHVAVRAWTLGFFAPNIIYFQNVAKGLAPAKDLMNKTKIWITLNYVRVALFIFISIGLIPIIFKAL